MFVAAFGKNRLQPTQALASDPDSAICAFPSTGSRSGIGCQRQHLRPDRFAFDLQPMITRHFDRMHTMRFILALP
jgi:hypothetical protein